MSLQQKGKNNDLLNNENESAALRNPFHKTAVNDEHNPNVINLDEPDDQVMHQVNQFQQQKQDSPTLFNKSAEQQNQYNQSQPLIQAPDNNINLDNKSFLKLKQERQERISQSLKQSKNYLNQNEKLMGKKQNTNIQDLNFPIQKTNKRFSQNLSHQTILEVGQISRSIQLKKKTYTYVGPANNDIVDLLSYMEEWEAKDQQNALQRVYHKYRDQIDACFNRCCTIRFSSTRKANFSFDDLILLLGYAVGFGALYYQLRKVQDERSGNNSEWKQKTNQTVLIIALLLSAFSYIMLYIRNKIVILLLFCGMVFAPMFFLAYQFNWIFKSDRDIITDKWQIAICAELTSSLLYSWLIGSIKRGLDEQYGSFQAAIYTLLLHFVIVVLVLAQLYETILVSNNYDEGLVLSILQAITFPTMALVLLSWCYMHFRYFKLSLSVIERAVLHVSRQIRKGYLKKHNVSINTPHPATVFLNRYLHIISSAFIGGLYLFCQYYTLLWLKTSTVNMQNNQDLAKTMVLATIFFITPVFLLLGISCVVTPRLTNKNKFLLVPMFLGALPMALLMPIAQYLKENYGSVSSSVQYILQFGPPAFIVFWLSMMLIGVQKRKTFFTIFTFLCMFFMFPLTFLVPLYLVNVLDSSAKIIGYVLLLIGSGIVAIVLLYKMLMWLYHIMLKQVTKRKLLQLNKINQETQSKYKNDVGDFKGASNRRKKLGNELTLAILAFKNWKDYAFCVNGTAFVLGFGFLMYAQLNRPSTISNDKQGLINGSILLFPVLFVLMNVVIRIHKTEQPSTTLDQLSRYQERPDLTREERKNIKIRRVLVKCVVLTGVIAPPAICIPLTQIISYSRTVQTTLLVITIGLPVICLIFFCCVAVKNFAGKLYNMFTPFIVMIAWCFVFFPVFIILPAIASQLDNQSEKFQTFMQLTVALAALLCIVGISLFSIVMNIFLNKIEFEKRMRFVINIVNRKLREKGVKSDNIVLSRIYEQFSINGESEFRKRIIQGNPANYWPVAEDDPDLRYSKQLVTKEAYERLMKKLQEINNAKNKKKDEQQNKKRCIERIVECCCKIDDAEDEKFELELERLRKIKMDLDNKGADGEDEEGESLLKLIADEEDLQEEQEENKNKPAIQQGQGQIGGNEEQQKLHDAKDGSGDISNKNESLKEEDQQKLKPKLSSDERASLKSELSRPLFQLDVAALLQHKYSSPDRHGIDALQQTLSQLHIQNQPKRSKADIDLNELGYQLAAQPNTEKLNLMQQSVSEKTSELRALSTKQSEVEKQRHKFSEHGQTVRTNADALEKWVTHVFEYFSSEDRPTAGMMKQDKSKLAPASSTNTNQYVDNIFEGKTSIAYNDCAELLKIAGIQNSDFDEQNSLISKQEFDNIFLKTATLARPSSGSLGLDKAGFGAFLCEVALLISPASNQEQGRQSAKDLACDMLYPNLMAAIPHFAMNYKQSVRHFTKENEKGVKKVPLFEVMDQITGNKNFNVLQFKQQKINQLKQQENNLANSSAVANPFQYDDPSKLYGQRSQIKPNKQAQQQQQAQKSISSPVDSEKLANASKNTSLAQIANFNQSEQDKSMNDLLVSKNHDLNEKGNVLLPGDIMLANQSFINKSSNLLDASQDHEIIEQQLKRLETLHNKPLSKAERMNQYKILKAALDEKRKIKQMEIERLKKEAEIKEQMLLNEQRIKHIMIKQKKELIKQNCCVRCCQSLFGTSQKLKTQKTQKSVVTTENVDKDRGCIYNFFCLWPKQCGLFMSKKMAACGVKLGFKAEDYDIEDEIEEQEELVSRRYAPEWPIISELMIMTINDAEFQYDKLEGEKVMHLHFNIDNLVVVFGRIADFVTLSLYAFGSGIPWYDSAQDMNAIQGTGPLYKQYQVLFYFSISLTGIYALLAKPAITHAQAGTLGIDGSTGRNAMFPHPQWFMTKIISLVGATFFMIIMKSFIDTFVCNYDLWPYKLQRDSSIECFSGTHLRFCGIGAIGLFIYYPLSTFLFPNFQFQEKSLDLKYSPSYLVIFTQAKLIISGTESFFKNFGTSQNSITISDSFPILLQLGIQVILMLVLAALSIFYQPCLIKRFNLFDATSHLMVAMMCISAIVLIITGNRVLALLLMGIGLLAIVSAAVVIFKKVFGTNKILAISKLQVNDDRKINELIKYQRNQVEIDLKGFNRNEQQEQQQLINFSEELHNNENDDQKFQQQDNTNVDISISRGKS